MIVLVTIYLLRINTGEVDQRPEVTAISEIEFREEHATILGFVAKGAVGDGGAAGGVVEAKLSDCDFHAQAPVAATNFPTITTD